MYTFPDERIEDPVWNPKGQIIVNTYSEFDQTGYVFAIDQDGKTHLEYFNPWRYFRPPAALSNGIFASVAGNNLVSIFDQDFKLLSQFELQQTYYFGQILPWNDSFLSYHTGKDQENFFSRLDLKLQHPPQLTVPKTGNTRNTFPRTIFGNKWVFSVGNRIYLLDEDLNLIKETLNPEYCSATAEYGGMRMVARCYSHVMLYDEKGATIRKFDVKANYQSVLFVKDSLVIGDKERTLHQFDLDGKFIRKVALGFYLSAGLQVFPDGTLAVATKDRASHSVRVTMFDSSLNQKGSFTTKGDRIGIHAGFGSQTDLRNSGSTVGSKLAVYGIDNAVYLFDASAKLVRKIGPFPGYIIQTILKTGSDRFIIALKTMSKQERLPLILGFEIKSSGE